MSDKSTVHIVSDNTCGDCHNSTGWSDAIMDHSSVSGTCESCHLSHKSTDHVDTASTCGDCHNQMARSYAIMDHSSVNGTCQSCHMSDKSTDHIVDQCKYMWRLS